MTHTVTSGETLSAIALKYNIPLSELVRYNNIADTNNIKIGLLIKIPSNLPSRTEIISAAWANENPLELGKQKNGTYVAYSDPNGRGLDVGPGLLIGSGIAKKPFYTREELDDAAYDFGSTSLKAIGDAYNEKYGTLEVPTPWDTVSVAPKLLMLDTRYQNGSLPSSGWPSLYKAVSEGNWGEALRLSRSKYTDEDGVLHYDNDRVRRRAESLFPGMFNVSFIENSKKLPTVTKKKALGGCLNGENLHSTGGPMYPFSFVSNAPKVKYAKGGYLYGLRDLLQKKEGSLC